MPKKMYTGINIQYPISKLILEGKKTIETRTYPIPSKYLNNEMLMIETPGKNGTFAARIVAIIKFTECFQYKSKNKFHKDILKHHVQVDSLWDWKNKAKWGWRIGTLKVLRKKVLLSCRKGIVYTKNITL